MTEHTFPGQALRERRDEMGVSVSDVYRATHIPDDFVEALERGSLDALPAPTYALGFLKTYCRFLDLEAEPFLDSYRACTRPAPSGRFLRRRRDATSPSLLTALWATDMVAWCTVCAILVLGWFAYTVVVRPNAEPAENRVEAGELMIPPVDGAAQ
ncbi:MAG: helix-turn-helix domain-containing protein [Candidatus Hydrogenedentes bacterium]|nr:helix-turn-helix domain-containing protein [Candidatus Hydrogenedentota bacterium]